MTAVSVVMPVFNGAAFVEEAVRSILAQTHRELELIVVDDGSTDRTTEILDALARDDGRVRLIEREHEGHAAAANAGVALARGGWIARMDADDVALPRRLEVQLGWAERHGLDVCGAGLVDKFGAEAGRLWFPERHGDIERELVFRVAMLHPTMLYRAEPLRACPYRDGAGADDYEQQVALSGRWRLGNVPELLARHRVHPAQVHITRAGQFRGEMRAARRRHLDRIFPEAAAGDEDLLEKIALRLPAASLEELEQMAAWLARLAGSDDPLLRRRMLLRWWTCCTRSTALGPGVARLFDAHAPRFDLPSLALPRRLLRLRALLRADPGGWASRAFRRLGPRVGSIG